MTLRLTALLAPVLLGMLSASPAGPVAWADTDIAAGAPSGATQTADDEGDSLTWGLAPAPGDGPERANYAYTLDPGQSVGDGIVVTNRSSRAIDLDVYARDALTTADGNLDLQPAAEQPTGLGTWIAFETSTIHLEPGESTTVAFTVAVPPEVGPGDYGGGIVTSVVADAATGAVTVDRRLALRAFVRVNGELSPALEVREATVAAPSGINPFATTAAKTRIAIANTGNARLVPTVNVEVTGPFGWLAAAGPTWVGEEILPGSVIVQEIEVPGVRALGRVNARIAITAAAVGVGGTGLTAQATGRAAAWAIPWSLLAVIAAVGPCAWWLARCGGVKGRVKRTGAPPP
ncbi:MAG: DUF916 domain-containing protein [Bifidobacteriaceae bacterium]|jgi:hypothetical protein|nr:DUF916 domain-containing protein [Bifidobacteriaceae bacterium]